MPIRRILLAIALVMPIGLFVRHQWVESRLCAREFGPEGENDDYEICTTYGANPEGFCAHLDRSPFSCSTDFIAGHQKLVAARRTGLFRARLECAAGTQISSGTRCSPEQWDSYCTKYHSGARSLRRCRSVGPDGPEGAPPGEVQAAVSAPVGPLSGAGVECGTLTIYELPGVAPGSVAVDDDGSVWFTEPQIGALSHMTLTGKVTRRFLASQLGGALARAPGGDLWFTDRGTNAIWQVRPNGETRRYPIPTTTGRATAGPGGPSGSGPSDITIGADGSVWFVETEADQVGRITPDGKITEVPLFGPRDGFIRPGSITAGPDGSMWVSATLARRIARVNGQMLTVTQFPVSSGGGTITAASVAADADGGVWFEQPTASAMDNKPLQPALGRMDRGGSIKYHPLPGRGPRGPGSLIAGPDGAIWFLDGSAGTVGRMATDGTVTEFPFAARDVGPLSTAPRQLAAGPNALWFAQPHTNSLGLITCQGRR
jgi:virginiamycin B lyase